MKYCNKCEKQTPTKTVDGKDECMVCGAPIQNSLDTNFTPKIKRSKDKKYDRSYQKSKNQTPRTGIGFGTVILISAGAVMFFGDKLNTISDYLFFGVLMFWFFMVLNQIVKKL